MGTVRTGGIRLAWAISAALCGAARDS